MIPAFLNLGTPEIILIIIALFALPLLIILPIIAVIKAAGNTSLSKTDTLLWMLLILLVPVIGSLLYFVIGNNKRAVTLN